MRRWTLRTSLALGIAAALTLALQVPTEAKSPKNLKELRDHQEWKLNKGYKEGHFYFTSQTEEDGKPALLISSKLKAKIHPKYIEMAEAKKAKGEKVAQRFMCAGTYTFLKGKWTFTCTAGPGTKEHQDEIEESIADFLRQTMKKPPKRDEVDCVWAGGGSAGDRIQQSHWGTVKEPKSEEDQFKDDVKMWTNVVHPPDEKFDRRARDMREIVARIALLYRYGGFMYRKEAGDKWKPFPYPVASLLSHGGRVLIGVRDEAETGSREAFVNWLWTGKAVGKSFDPPKCVAGRTASTHGVNFDGDAIAETKGKVSGLKGMLSSDRDNFGMNVPVGGFGSIDSNGKAVDDKGQHGHILFFVRRAGEKDKKWDCAVLIGCEGSEPGMTDQFGHKHDWRGKSSAISPTGGQKWKKMKAKIDSCDTMRIIIYDKKQLAEVESLVKRAMSDREWFEKEVLAEKPEKGKKQHFEK